MTQTQERPAQGLFDDRPPAYLAREEEEMPASVMQVQQVPSAPVSGELGQLADLMRMAQTTPDRDINRLKREAVRIGRELKADGYYSFPAGAQRIEGATVWMMEALEGAWRLTFTQVQVERVEGRRVHLRARFVDLKTGVIKERPAFYTMSDPPGKFAGKQDQIDRWHAMQLGSATSKAARSVLEHGLPSWFTETAVQSAMAAARENLLNGRTMEQAVRETISYFADLKITQAELEAQQEQPVALWVDLNILDLRDLARALKQGQTTIEAVFGPVRERLAAAAPAPAAATAKPPRGSALGVSASAAKEDAK